MASIRNTLSLTDQMTPVLRSVLKALNSTLRVMDMVNKQSSAGIQSKAFKQAEKDIQRANNALIKMGNYAELGNSKIQSSTEKSIRQLNAVEAAARGIHKGLSAIGNTEFGQKITAKALNARNALKNFSLSGMFNNMQAKGTNMMDMSRMLGGTNIQRTLSATTGAMMQSIGSLGSRITATMSRVGALVSPTFSRIGSACVTAFSVARNSITQFAAAAANAMNSLTNKAKIAWQGVASGIYVIKNVMSALSSLTKLTDQSLSDMAKLDVQNYSGTSKSEAYGLAYQAAQASRSDISSTASLASRISMSGVYGKQEGSLESSLNMAETIQKALAVGGGTQEENSRAILQLSQGLASGQLMGDELRSIREQSPYLAETLAQGLAKVDSSFIGTTAGDLKELGAQGKLTSDVVIKAFEAMEGEIDQTFEDKAPKTWAQGITSIMNTVKYFMGILQDMEGGPLEKITNLVWVIADYLQSAEGMQLLAGIATVLGVVGDVLSFVVNAALTGISWLMDNSYVLIAILLVIGAILLWVGLTALFSWLMAIWPLLLIIAIVALVIAWIQSLGVTTGQIVGAIAGAVTWFVGLLWNCVLAVIGFFKGLWAALGAIWDNIGIGVNNLIQGAKEKFWSLLETVANVVKGILEALNKIPGVDLTGAISWAEGKATEYADKAQEARDNKQDYVDVGAAFQEGYNSMGAFQEGWSSEWFGKGYDWGNNLVEGMGDMTSGLEDSFDMSGAGVGTTTVDGGNLDSVGSIGSDVNISDEDLKLLRDMAARDYLLQLQTVTPVANVTFGDVKETADVKKIVEVIENMVDEQMATALVG